MVPATSAKSKIILDYCFTPSSCSLSFALCKTVAHIFGVTSAFPRFHSVSLRKIRSWIIGVHKVLNYISNFYSKNSTFHKPCSHRHSLGFYKASTLCLHKIRSWIIASRLQAVRLVLRHAKPPLTFSALLRRSLVSTRSAYAKSVLGLLLHAFNLFA